jgi:hypothetical protein
MATQAHVPGAEVQEVKLQEQGWTNDDIQRDEQTHDDEEAEEFYALLQRLVAETRMNFFQLVEAETLVQLQISMHQRHLDHIRNEMKRRADEKYNRPIA